MCQLREGNSGNEGVIPAIVSAGFLCRFSRFQLFSEYFREVLPTGAGWGLGGDAQAPSKDGRPGIIFGGAHPTTEVQGNTK